MDSTFLSEGKLVKACQGVKSVRKNPLPDLRDQAVPGDPLLERQWNPQRGPVVDRNRRKVHC